MASNNAQPSPRLIRLLTGTSTRLRNLARKESKEHPLTASGHACEHVAEIEGDLRSLGHFGAADALAEKNSAILGNVGAIIVPSMCGGDPAEVVKWSNHLGVTPVLDERSLISHGLAFVGSLIQLADQVDSIRADFKRDSEIQASPRSAKNPGRKPKTKPNKVDLVVAEMIDCGDVAQYDRQWKMLIQRYEKRLPTNYTADALRKRVNAELERRKRKRAG